MKYENKTNIKPLNNTLKNTLILPLITLTTINILSTQNTSFHKSLNKSLTTRGKIQTTNHPCASSAISMSLHTSVHSSYTQCGVNLLFPTFLEETIELTGGVTHYKGDILAITKISKISSACCESTAFFSDHKFLAKILLYFR